MRGFRAALTARCHEICASDSTQCCTTITEYDGELPSFNIAYISIGWFYGPFHTDHVGIYPVTGSNTVKIRPVNPPLPAVDGGYTIGFTGVEPSCITFLGYKVYLILPMFWSLSGFRFSLPSQQRLTCSTGFLLLSHQLRNVTTFV